MKRISQSLAMRLTSQILFGTVILFIITIVIIAVSSRKMIEQEASRGAENILKATVNGINEVLIGVESSVISTKWIVQENRHNPEYMFTITSNLVRDNDFIVGSTVAFIPNYYSGKGDDFAPYSYKSETSDSVQTFQLGNENYDYHMMEWFQVPYLLKKPYWSEPYFDTGGSEQMITTFSVPLTDEAGEVYAILTADMSLNHLTDEILSAKPYPHSYTILTSNNGSYISHPIRSRILNETILSNAYERGDSVQISVAKDIIDKNTGIRKFVDENGEKSLAFFRPLTNGWSAAIVCPYRDVLAQTWQMHVLLIIVLVVGLVLLVLFCPMLIHRMMRPLTEFSNSARSIAQGNFQTQLPEITSRDEMKNLYDSFAYMQTSLNNYITELQRTTIERQRIESELSIAQQIQFSMLPTTFCDNLYALLHPAKEVGGDLYDFHNGSNLLQFAIGDVSGKGVPAALFMALVHSSLKYVAGLNTDPDVSVIKINDSICAGNKEMLFVTMFVARYHKDTHVLEYCNAGHNPIVVIEPAQGENELNAYLLHAKPNFVVGLMSGFKYKSEKKTLPLGTRLIVYTDGVTEAENAEKEQYGEERLLEFARKSLVITEAKACTEALLKDVNMFTAGNEQNDDITIMTIDL